jgi:hypothetical protein
MRAIARSTGCWVPYLGPGWGGGGPQLIHQSIQSILRSHACVQRAKGKWSEESAMPASARQITRTLACRTRWLSSTPYYPSIQASP